MQNKERQNIRENTMSPLWLSSKLCAISSATMRNERYNLDAPSTSDHENEDRWLTHGKDGPVYLGVFDGHDGPLAVEFVRKYFEDNWKNVSKMENPNSEQMFVNVEKEFFRSIDACIKEKAQIQSEIPKGMKSFEAHQKFPDKVERLQQLETSIAGGCTAVIAIVSDEKLVVANVGDSRVVLVKQKSDGGLSVTQLSVDHGVENEEELDRLEALGLDREQLKKSGRLGTQENTRSIGDYSIKEGYKDVDIISHAAAQPGSAVPSMWEVDVDTSSFKYLILMSDGVYKTLEAADCDENGEATWQSLNDRLAEMIERMVSIGSFNDLSARVLDEIYGMQVKRYQESARQDPCSPVAVANRKRDDMTLVLYRF